MNLFGFGDASQFGERELVDRYLNSLGHTGYVIDIGAADGIYASNTYHLFKRGACGVAIEYDPVKFTRLAKNYQDFTVSLCRAKATPENITDLLRGSGCPTNPAYLSLDIDSCDYYVLDSILDVYRPTLITVEINETVPPGIDFRVLPTSPVAYTPGSHFYGMSISALGELCNHHDYDLVALNYVNAFLIPREKKWKPAISPKEAYNHGYWQRPDRTTKFPNNADVDGLYGLPPDDAIKRIVQMFGEYTLVLPDSEDL